jgi:hypothetical protein
MPGQIELGGKYFELSRDMFYSRITEDKMNEEYLRSLIYEVRKVLQDAIQHKSIECQLDVAVYLEFCLLPTFP